MASRSAWRLHAFHPMVFSPKFLGRKSIKTAARSMTLPYLSSGGRSFYVHDGRSYVQVIYKKEMAGFKLGSFVPTKKIGYQPKKKPKKKKPRK